MVLGNDGDIWTDPDILPEFYAVAGIEVAISGETWCAGAPIDILRGGNLAGGVDRPRHVGVKT